MNEEEMSRIERSLGDLAVRTFACLRLLKIADLLEQIHQNIDFDAMIEVDHIVLTIRNRYL